MPVSEKKYTPTPWVAEGQEILTRKGEKVASASSSPNARRIVATANACKAVPTEDLELGIVAELVFHCGKLKNATIQAILERMRRS